MDTKDNIRCGKVHTITGHTSDITAVAFTPTTLASCSSDKTVRLWEVGSGYREASSSPLCGHLYTVHCCVFSPCGKMLASCSTDGLCVIWVVATGQQMATLRHPSGTSLRSCCFAPNGKLLATGSDDEKLCIWDLNTYALLRTLEGPEASIVAITFSPHSELLIAGSSGGDLRVWDGLYGHGRPLALVLEAHDLGVTCVAVSPNYGSAVSVPSPSVHQVHYLLASGGFDNTLKLWDILTTRGSPNVQIELRAALKGHSGPVMGCSFSQAHRLVASVGADKSVRIWDPVKKEAVSFFEAHSRYVTCCAFSFDGLLLATGSNDKKIHIWSLSPEHLPTDPSNVSSKQREVPKNSRQQEPKSWTIHDVSDWLMEIGLSQYVPSFIENFIDGAELLALTDETMRTALKINALGHRSKLIRAIKDLNDHHLHRSLSDDSVPDEYLCPITREIMTDPVMAADGYTYERQAISSWLDSGKTNSPMTNAPLLSVELTPNRSLKMLLSRHAQHSS